GAGPIALALLVAQSPFVPVAREAEIPAPEGEKAQRSRISLGIEHDANSEIVRSPPLEQRRVDQGQVLDPTEVIQRAEQRRERGAIPAVQIRDDVTLGQRVIVELITLTKRRDVAVDPPA